MTYLVDLHLHSYYSDGSYSPKQIIEMASQLGLSAISITDHDHFTCTTELIRYAASLHIELIPGIELSCVEKSTGRKVHLLAYKFHDVHPHIDALIEPFKKKAMQDRLNMMKHLNAQGIPIQREDVLSFSHGMLYKQHIALALEKLGYGNYTSLYSKYFKGENNLENIYPPTFIPIKDAIEAVLLDGGIPVLAHPRSYNTFDMIEKYIQWGLKGIEISHPSFKEGDLDLILNYPLIHTGGSDFHGDYNLSSKRQMGHYGINLNEYNKLKEIKKQ